MNVKPGDLAILIAGELAGSIVNVIRFIRENEKEGRFYSSITGWLVDDVGGMDFICPCGTPTKTAVFPDAWLRPVSGLPDAEQIDQQEPIKELA